MFEASWKSKDGKPVPHAKHWLPVMSLGKTIGICCPLTDETFHIWELSSPEFKKHLETCSLNKEQQFLGKVND